MLAGFWFGLLGHVQCDEIGADQQVVHSTFSTPIFCCLFFSLQEGSHSGQTFILKPKRARSQTDTTPMLPAPKINARSFLVMFQHP